MANTVYMLRGLPGADFDAAIARIKSSNKDNFAIISAQELQTMFLGSYNPEYNMGKIITDTYRALIEQALKNNKNVILRDTNLDPLHRHKISKMLESITIVLKYKPELVVIEVDTPLGECIQRDLKQPNSLGPSRLRFLYRKYISPFPGYVDNYSISDKPKAVIVDIDSTVAHNPGTRGWYEDEKVYQDEVKITIAKAVAAVANQEDCKVIFVTGRNELKSGKCRDLTNKWIKDKLLPVMDLKDEEYELHMRSYKDMRSDDLVKKDIYLSSIKENYNVILAFEDRNRICSMYRSNGLVVMQVAEGDY